MNMTDIYLDTQLSKVQQLLWSGSLHEVDEAHNLIVELIDHRLKPQGLPRVPFVQTTKPFYEKTLRTISKKSQIVGDYVICRIFQIHTKPSNLSISNLQTSYLPNLYIQKIWFVYYWEYGYIFLSPPFLRPCGAPSPSTIRHYEAGI